jgi:hypothetical protein
VRGLKGKVRKRFHRGVGQGDEPGSIRSRLRKNTRLKCEQALSSR